MHDKCTIIKPSSKVIPKGGRGVRVSITCFNQWCKVAKQMATMMMMVMMRVINDADGATVCRGTSLVSNPGRIKTMQRKCNRNADD